MKSRWRTPLNWHRSVQVCAAHLWYFQLLLQKDVHLMWKMSASLLSARDCFSVALRNWTNGILLTSMACSNYRSKKPRRRSVLRLRICKLTFFCRLIQLDRSAASCLDIVIYSKVMYRRHGTYVLSIIGAETGSCNRLVPKKTSQRSDV